MGGVLLTAYGSCHAVRIMETAPDDVPGGKVVSDIAAKHGRSAIQVFLKWTLQNGVTIISRSHSEEHLKSNLEAIDESWQLSDEDMAALDALDENHPYYWDESAPLRTLGA